MANKKYAKIRKPRVAERSFDKLVGHQFPNNLNKKDDGVYGKYIDNLIKRQLQVIDPGNGNPDLTDYDIELKSKKDTSDANWTIANMTAIDIINTSYINSAVYRKMQALLLITHDTTKITKIDLTYLDNDDVQESIEQYYEDVRQQLKNYVNFQGYFFDNSQQFKHRSGVLEYANIANNFKFRIKCTGLQKMLNMSASTLTRDQFFEFA